MGAFLPLLGGLVGSQLGGSTVTDWLGGSSKIPTTAYQNIPGMGSTTPLDLQDLALGPDFVPPTTIGKIPPSENPTGTTLGINNETLGPILAGLAGSMALTPFASLGFGDGSGEVPSLPGLQQRAFGNIASQQAPQPQYKPIGLPQGYVGKKVSTADELLRLLRGA